MSLENRSPPPAALYVCIQSRQAALRHGYQLAFKGHNCGLAWDSKRFWEDNHFSDKGVWIDFERDMIMVDSSQRDFYSSGSILRLISQHAMEDVRKIKRIAVCGEYKLSSAGEQFYMRKTTFRDWGFIALEEIYLDFDARLISNTRMPPFKGEWPNPTADEFYGERLYITKATSTGPACGLPHITVLSSWEKLFPDWHGPRLRKIADCSPEMVSAKARNAAIHHPRSLLLGGPPWQYYNEGLFPGPPPLRWYLGWSASFLTIAPTTILQD